MTVQSTSRTNVRPENERSFLCSKWAHILSLMALSLFGSALLFYITRWGIGISPDSVIYIGVARNLLAGQGLRVPFGEVINSPLTFHPPLYPMMLALIGFSGKDPTAGARLLNVLLFGGNLFLSGYLLSRVSKRRRMISVAGAYFLLTSVSMLLIHIMAWTEAVFIFFGFLGLSLLTQYLERRKWPFLIVASITIGLAFLTRFVGAAYIGTGILVLLLFGPRNMQRMIDAVIFGFLATLPMALWTIQNMYLSEAPPSRQLFYHPIGKAQALQALETFSGWLLIPTGIHPVLKIGLIVLALVVLFNLFILQLKMRTNQVSMATSAAARELPRLVWSLGLFILVYGMLLILSISFFDNNTPLDERILSPIFFAATILLLWLVDRLWHYLAGHQTARLLMIAIGLFYAIAYTVQAANWTTSNQGQIHAIYRYWQQSEIIQKVKQLPDEVMIYSNAPETIYLYTGKPVLRTPRTLESTTGQFNQSYSSDLLQIKTKLDNRSGILVFFNGLGRRTLPTEQELVDALQVSILFNTIDGTIYGNLEIR